MQTIRRQRASSGNWRAQSRVIATGTADGVVVVGAVGVGVAAAGVAEVVGADDAGD